MRQTIMNNRERIEAILGGGIPDRIPFLPFSELIPRGSYEREMRARGMGFIVHGASLWSEMPSVEVSQRTRDGEATATYRTPVGEVMTKYRTHAQGASNNASVQQEWLIKGVEDYHAVIFMIDDTTYHVDQSAYRKAVADLGDDGIVHTWTDEPPYMDAQYFLGLEKWSYDQYDHPNEFRALLEALARRQERRLQMLLECPDSFINLGNLAGNFGPSQYKEYILPYYHRYVPWFRDRGKRLTIHADALNLSRYLDLVPLTEVKIIEAFTPPPVGDLALRDARGAWGEDVTIWINFPETVFYGGYDATRRYVIELLQSDPCPNKFLGMTEMGLMGVNESNEAIFKEGIRAIMDGLDELGPYRK